MGIVHREASAQSRSLAVYVCCSAIYDHSMVGLDGMGGVGWGGVGWNGMEWSRDPIKQALLPEVETPTPEESRQI